VFFMSVMSSITQLTNHSATRSDTRPATRSTGLSQPYVYFVPLNGALSPADYEVGLALGWLSDDELAKVGRYKSVSARHNALQVRIALRAVLSLHSALKPQQWRFIYGAKGKPALTQDLLALTGLHFNLSHSGQWLMIGVLIAPNAEEKTEPTIDGASNEWVYNPEQDICFGVDIERQRSSTDIVPILNHYFTQTETNTLLQLPEALQRQRFFDLWAVKESYIKARGLGLALSLKSFSVDFSQAEQCNIPLQRADNHSQSIELLKPVKLNFTDSKQPVATDFSWQTVMGRLDNEYRFAVTLGLANSAVSNVVIEPYSIYNTLSCARLSFDDLLG
jgi:4'-phosphopantetheinyl transferase